MNFKFKVGDKVVLRTDTEKLLTLVKKFAGDVFWAEESDGTLLRVRTPQLLRVERPSDEIRRAAVEHRKLERLKMKEMKERRYQSNVEQFANMQELGVRLTAEGLPDQRVKKIRYSAKNAPKVIKPGKRGL